MRGVLCSEDPLLGASSLFSLSVCFSLPWCGHCFLAVDGRCMNCLYWQQRLRRVAWLSIDTNMSSPAFTVSDAPSSHFQGVLDRFSQIQPKLIFSVEAVVYNGREHGHLEKLQRVVKGTWGPAPRVCPHMHRFVSRGVLSLHVRMHACVYVNLGLSPGALDVCTYV